MQAPLGDYAFFILVSDYLRRKIILFQSQTVEQASRWVGTMALVLVTLWIMIQGYRIVTGQSRDSMMVLVVHASRTGFVVMAATTLGITGGSLQRFLSEDLGAEINWIVTGERSTAADQIDRNLAYTQLAMAAIDAVHTSPVDSELLEAKTKASTMATLGVAGPPMVAGAMLLLYQFTVAIFVGLGPLFILCLMFDQTKDLFRKWLTYGVGTFFSLAMLNVVTTICLKLTIGVAAALWTADVIGSITGTGAEGLSNQSLQQGGIGLLMTVLIVAVPPLAAAFFSGTVGHFISTAAFGRSPANGMQGPQGHSFGTYAGTSNGVGNAYADENRSHGTPSPNFQRDASSGGSTQAPVADEVKAGRTAKGEWT